MTDDEEKIMYAEKLLLETDEHGDFKQQLHLPLHSKMEVIILVLEKLPVPKRKPATEIAGKARILADIVQPIVPIEDWQDLV